MADKVQRFSKTAGLPPGTLIHVGKQRTDHVRVRMMTFNEGSYADVELSSLDALPDTFDENTVHWINIDGLHQTDVIARFGERFKLHPLLLEDILDTHQRPKVDEYDDYLFVSMKMLGIDPETNGLVSEQVSLVLGDCWLLTFQEQEGDIFDALRRRIAEGKGIIRKKSVDYLLYRLIDTTVDNYFFVTEYFTEHVSGLEEIVLESPDKEHLKEIQRFKKLNSRFRRLVAPLREVLLFLEKDETVRIKNENNRYFRDVHDHVVQAIDTTESLRDLLANAMDLYLSGVSNQMNQVMQVLTIIATIFIPLTFIAGIYGMNFDEMPELHWDYGYYAVWGVMIAIFIAMLIYFRRKKWL